MIRRFIALVLALAPIVAGEPSDALAAVRPLTGENPAPSMGTSSDFEAALEALGRGDLAAARRRLRTAAEAGHVRAAAVLGAGLVQGTFGGSEPEEGVRWLRYAAARRDADAQYDLGVSLYSGIGAERDVEGAFRWFKEAAEAGHPEAAYNVGTFYDDGNVVAKDEAKAAEWYRKAVDGEVAEAMHTLGMMYAAGRGVPRDLNLAAELLARAREEGDHDVEEDIDELRRTVPANEKEALEAALRR